MARWKRYNPYYMEPEPRKEVYRTPETDLSEEQKKERDLKAVSPIKAAPPMLTSSVFNDLLVRYGILNGQCISSAGEPQRLLVCYHYLKIDIQLRPKKTCDINMK